MAADPRRAIPSTDRLLALPEVQAATDRLAPHVIRRVITETQNDARHGRLSPTTSHPPSSIASYAVANPIVFGAQCHRRHYPYQSWARSAV